MPCPMRFGPPPRIMIFRCARSAPPRTRPRRSSRGTACAPRTRRRRCRRACRRAARRCCARSARTSCSGDRPEVGEPPVGEAELLRGAEPAPTRSDGAAAPIDASALDDLLQVAQEPRIDLRALEDLLDARRRAGTPRRSPTAGPAAARRSARQQLLEPRLPFRQRGPLEPGVADLERAQRLLEALLEGAPDRHRLADRLHLRGQQFVRARELLEGEARDLGDDVVDASARSTPASRA